ncbi:uncharacterized protein K02A2.6-like [Uranotaenia lowii]|uniref:uncharacterized protein K02A2.6-like n=1 Tax=Uranotaenia lowii TaxID=190385 RepID=UPI002478FF94|nr:uncharacterized protein K02A2.6-like [Uranotaenia lowii]
MSEGGGEEPTVPMDDGSILYENVEHLEDPSFSTENNISVDEAGPSGAHTFTKEDLSPSPTETATPRIKVYSANSTFAGPWVVFFRPKPNGKPLNVIQITKTLAKWSSVTSVTKVNPSSYSSIRVFLPDYDISSVQFDLSMQQEIRGIPEQHRPFVVPRIFYAKYGHVNAEQMYFTDGSLINECTGFGVYNKISCASYSLQSPCSVYIAELAAIHWALDNIATRTVEHYFIVTDSLSSVEAIRSIKPGKHSPYFLEKIRITLSALSRRCFSITFVWVPSHCSIVGNEKADSLAKEHLIEMDPSQFQAFLEHQSKMFGQMLKSISVTVQQQNQHQQQQQPTTSSVPVPQPSPLLLEGDMAENFDFFEKSWRNYESAMGMDKWPVTEHARKVNVLLSVIGEQARKKFSNFELTAAEQESSEAALIAIKAKVVAKRNVIVDRLDFFSAVQASMESIDDFTARLRVLAKVARLGELDKELIAYKIVTANKWPHLRTKMLTISDITLEKAVDLCRAEEIAAKRSQELGIHPSQSAVNKIFKAKSQAKQSLPRCKFCGDNHEFAKGSGRTKSQKSRRVNEVKEETDTEPESSSSENESSTEESGDEEYEIGKIYDNSSTGGSVLAEINLKFGKTWKSVLCEIDTGANTSLIGLAYLVKLSGVQKPELHPSKFRLQSFGGNPIKVLGQIKIPCRRLGRKFLLVLQVVDVDHRPLLSAKASRELGLVKFCNSVSFDDQQSASTNNQLFNVYRVKAQKIVDDHRNLFEGYGRLPGTVTLEIDSSITPSIQPPRRVPIAMRSQLKTELENLEKDGIITKETTHTDWVSNIVIVQRNGPGTGIRICLDPVVLNKALKRPNLQFVTLDEILPELGKARVFSTVDAKKGFWHVVLDEPSSKLTTFWTPFGRYRWIRLPFGVAPAPEIFQLKLQEVIQGLKGVECIADDLLVYGVGDTLEEALKNHNECLKELLCRLEEHHVKLNKSKLKLCQRSVKFYGHVLTDQGLKADDSKIAAIQKFPHPMNRKEVHRFVGMVTYLGRFIQNLTINLVNLRRLISESVPWRWSAVEEKEFQQVKALVADLKSLRYYDVNEPLVIECDASSIGLGVAVFQKNGVIGYASRTLTPTERNYAQIEKELLAILFACVRFDQLVVGNPKTTIRTDHKPLLNVFQKPLLSAPRRLQHMLLNLQRYNISIEYVTGKENVIADALSRAPLQESPHNEEYHKRCIFKVFEEIQDVKLSTFLNVSSSRLDEIIRETEKDQSIQLVIDYIRHGWPGAIDNIPDSVKIYFGYRSELSTQDGLVFRNDCILIPYVLRKKLVESCHASHNGVEATLRLARANLFWPGMSSQIKEAVKSCTICAKFAASQPNPPMKSHAIPVHPFQVVSMDVFFYDQQGSKRKFLITVDHYSDFFEVNLLKDLSPETVIAVCKQNFARFGIPQRAIADNGTNFANQKMARFAAEWDFEFVTSAPHHPQANGKAESAVKIAKHLMKKAEESGTDFWYALLHWRNIPNKIGTSPAARLMSRSTRCGVPTAAAKLLPKPAEDVPAKIESNRQRTKVYYDRKTRNLPQLQIGSPVFVQLNPETSKNWSMGTVSNCFNDRSYLVDVNGTDYRRSLVHLKPRKDPNTQPSNNSPSDHEILKVPKNNPPVPDPTMTMVEATEGAVSGCPAAEKSVFFFFFVFV